MTTRRSPGRRPRLATESAVTDRERKASAGNPYKLHTVAALAQTDPSQLASYVGDVRSAILQIPDQRTAPERRRVLGTAIRQLERADLYLSAVVSMDLGDTEVRRLLDHLRRDLETVNRHLRAGRSHLSE